MTRTDHPYEYEPELLKRYPAATTVLDENEILGGECSLETQQRRRRDADRRHWQNIKQATEK